MIHILSAYISNDNGGLTKYIINNYKKINKEIFDMEFLTFEKNTTIFKDIQDRQGKIHFINNPKNILKYVRDLREILKKNKYDIIHINLSYANFISMMFFKLFSDATIIVHSHSTNFDDKSRIKRVIKYIIHKVGRIIMPYIGDEFFACCNLAGDWMFIKSIMNSNKYYLAHNAINLTNYRFNKTIRERKRKELGVDTGKIILGHVGRYTYQKNHEFLIELLEQLLQVKKNFILCLVGEGPEKKEIEKKVKEKKLSSYVLFLGGRGDVSELMQGFDAFLLPSRFEGLGLVSVEAQAAGLPCFISDAISRETKLIDNIFFLKLNNMNDWVETITKFNFDFDRKDTYEELTLLGYNEQNEINKIEKKYMEMCNLYEK